MGRPGPARQVLKDEKDAARDVDKVGVALDKAGELDGLESDYGRGGDEEGERDEEESDGEAARGGRRLSLLLLLLLREIGGGGKVGRRGSEESGAFGGV